MLSISVGVACCSFLIGLPSEYSKFVYFGLALANAIVGILAVTYTKNVVGSVRHSQSIN